MDHEFLNVLEGALVDLHMWDEFGPYNIVRKNERERAHYCIHRV
jgi:hypothetical protein